MDFKNTDSFSSADLDLLERAARCLIVNGVSEANARDIVRNNWRGEGDSIASLVRISDSFDLFAAGPAVVLDSRVERGNQGGDHIEAVRIPFFRLDDDKPERQFANAVKAMNQHIEKHGLQFVSVETIVVPGFLGFGLREVGLCVWVRAAQGVAR